MKAIYIRTSTEDQNPENQIAECENMSGPEYILFKDQQTAWKEEKERPGFHSLKMKIKLHKISDLYVWDIDRIYRSRRKIISFFQYCKLYRCKVHSVRQSFLDTIHTMPEPFDDAMFDFMLHIMGWMAEDESNKKSKRIKAAIRQREDGAYSYKGKKWGRKQVSTFKKNLISESYKKGESIRAISRKLNLSVGVVHKYITKLKEAKDHQIKVVHS